MKLLCGLVELSPGGSRVKRRDALSTQLKRVSGTDNVLSSTSIIQVKHPYLLKCIKTVE